MSEPLRNGFGQVPGLPCWGTALHACCVVPSTWPHRVEATQWWNTYFVLTHKHTQTHIRKREKKREWESKKVRESVRVKIREKETKERERANSAFLSSKRCSAVERPVRQTAPGPPQSLMLTTAPSVSWNMAAPVLHCPALLISHDRSDSHYWLVVALSTGLFLFYLLFIFVFYLILITFVYFFSWNVSSAVKKNEVAIFCACME